MKKIIIVSLLFTAIACSNPEDNATGTTTTDTSAGYNEENTLNTTPGPTSPDSVGGIDRSNVDTGTGIR